MPETLSINRLHQHRIWSNHRLLAAVQELSAEQLRQRFEIGQGSIWKTLTHLYAAEYVWLAALKGDVTPLTPGDQQGKLPGNQEGDNPIQTLSELEQRWRLLDKEWQGYLDALKDADLNRPINKVSSLSGQRSSTKCVDILLHVCTHAQYTTSQLINMLRQVGHTELPDVMLITMARTS
ncbi:DinB family protein [Rhodopirellula sp. MGV]|uniref:DinB family protein n=1 Tax=Rhodopirellula sp. MGV TaxID=2023130 RepID=UPI000B95E69C|nr:DinB family protein [Rhodopirellula sp. MGV]OYP33873.1 damage-inducible protein DinB [Rhodopirellula sp. MGV]PNY37294.1 DUF664 domain-containing protein [Rhodopirellula baltica]